MNSRHRRLSRAETTDQPSTWAAISDDELEVEIRRLQEGRPATIPMGRVIAAERHALAVLDWLDGKGEFPE